MHSGPSRRLRVDLDGLVDAFQVGSMEMTAYLDLVTGQVVWITDEVQQALETIEESLPQGSESSEVTTLEAMAEQLHPAWMVEAILEADLVARELETRFVEVPKSDSRESYRYMQDFILTVDSPHLQERLWEGIQGRGAFRRFKDILVDHPDERARWFDYEARRTREEVLDWLAAEGIEGIDQPERDT